jgi:hypothetical protein
MRDAVQTALLRIKQQIPNLTTSNFENPLDMRLMLRYLDVPNFRGTLNAMACLVEKHGLLQLQRVGVFGQGSGMHHVLCAK